MTTVFLFLFCCILAIVLVATAVGFNFLESQRKKQVKSMLRTVDGNPSEEAATHILFEAENHEDLMVRAVSRLHWAQGLETVLQQSGLNWSMGRLLAYTVAGAVIGLVLGWKFNILVFSPLSLVAAAAACSSVPYLYVRYKRRQRFAEFEEQFPEALDFLARSMRAGHAFSISLEMIGDESPDPLGLEFRTMFNEQNLGAPMEVALANMERRLPLVDVRFFISSIMLQKQTGGNLSEILTRLAHVIRERFRLKGQVKAASAHGRLTATILALLPVATMLGLLVVAPGYLQSMAEDPDGKWMIGGAIVAQILGNFFIKKIINIKV